MAQEISFDFITNSPQAQLTADISNVVTTIPVDFCEYFTVIPAPYTLTNDAGQAETVYVTDRSVSAGAGDLTVTREWDVQGTIGAARFWQSGDKISRNLGAKEQNTIIANISDHEARLADPETGHNHDGINSRYVSYTDITDRPSTFTPIAHATTHQAGGSDELALTEAQVTFNPTLGHDHNGTNSRQISAEDLLINSLAGSTIDNQQDLFDAIQSSGSLEPVTVIDSGSGTSINISAFKAVFKMTDSQVGANIVADVSAVNGLAIPTGLSWIVAKYNAGTPTIVNITTYESINQTTDFVIARCYRDGDLVILPTGASIYDVPSRDLQRIHDIRFIERANGLVISNPSGLYVGMSGGKIYTGYDAHDILAQDTSGTDVFTYYYQDGAGGFTRVPDRSTIDVTKYDDGSGTLAVISNDTYYGVHWVYTRYDGKIIIVYGTDEYISLAAAQEAGLPTSIPLVLREMALLVGKIIVQKTDTTFSDIQSAFTTAFVPSPITEHNDLSGIDKIGTGAGEYHADVNYASGWTVNKFDATVDPTVNEDIGDGYEVGSVWVNISADKIFVCADSSTGAAVWKDISSGADGLPTISGGDANKALRVKSDESGAEWIHAKRTILLSGAGGWPSTVSGSGGVTQIEMATNDVDLVGVSFPAGATALYHQYHLVMPTNYDGSTVTAKFYWMTNDATPSGDVSWKIQGQSYTDNDPLDAAWGSAIEVADTIIAQNDLHISSASGAVTIANTPTGGDMVAFRVMRDGSDASDTSANDVILLGVLISYTTDNYSDE